MIAFGPVPSRRLGNSLGINHIPPKNCPYSCVYCQVGRTNCLLTDRRAFLKVDQILRSVEQKIVESRLNGTLIDYLTLVPDGEPTLDINLKEIILGLRQFQIPVAIISNASLINDENVRQDLSEADWVSLKIDTVNEEIWRKVNRPNHKLSLISILNGIRTFRKEFPGTLVTETMLVADVNDTEDSINDTIEFLLEVKPNQSYLSIPIRPPAENWVRPPTMVSLQNILTFMSDKIPFMNLLFDAEIGKFSSTGILRDDILSITSVHPLRESSLHQLVNDSKGDWTTVEELLQMGEILKIDYRDDSFFIRNFNKKH
jgi:wyosine [tRNA(Phe)-imidazoG37] synthetase (radical SAM superfamily)